MEKVFQYGPSLSFPMLTVLWNNPLVQVLFSLVFFVPPTSVSSCWQNLKGDSHCVLSHQSVCVTEYCSEEMRNTSMLCFTSSTSLMVLQLKWRSVLCLGHYFQGVSVAQLLSVPPDAVLSLPCLRWNSWTHHRGASDRFQISSLHSNSLHKASSFPIHSEAAQK